VSNYQLPVGDGLPTQSQAYLLLVPDAKWFFAAVFGALNSLSTPDAWQQFYINGDEIGNVTPDEAADLGYEMVMQYFNPYPLGSIQIFASATPPPGFLLCDATNYLRIDYPEIWQTYPALRVDADTWRTPNFVNRLPVGISPTKSIMQEGGADGATLAINNVPPHTHDYAFRPGLLDAQAYSSGTPVRVSNYDLVFDIPTTGTFTPAPVNVQNAYLAVSFCMWVGR
jgi:hypothetical protein